MPYETERALCGCLRVRCTVLVIYHCRVGSLIMDPNRVVVIVEKSVDGGGEEEKENKNTPTETEEPERSM